MAKSILLPIVSSFASKGVKDAQTSLAGLGKTIGAATLSFLAFQSVVSTINFVGDSITQARDLERNFAGLKTVFGGAARDMESFAKTANVMGMSTSEAAKASTFLGTVLKSAGFDMQTTQTETQKLTALAADLAATYGYDVQEALTGMTALFRGEYDPIEKFGVAMKQSEINAELAARGQDNLTGAARRHAEQQIRLELLYQRTMDAQGAFARQSGSLYVEQTKLNAAFKDLEAKIGGALTPVLADLMIALQPILEDASGPLLQFFQELGSTIKDSLPFIKGLLGFLVDAFEVFNNLYAAMKPVIPMFVSLGVVVKGAQIAFALYATSALAAEGATVGLSAAIASNPIGLLVVALGLAVGGMILLNDQLKGTSSYMDEINKKREGFSRTGKYFDRPKYTSSGINTNNLSSITALSGPGWTTPKTTSAVDSKTKTSVKTQVTSLFDTLNGEVAKQQAYMKLKGLGASEGLISAILGSSNWQKALKDTLKKGVGATQALFNQTAAGVKEIEDQRKAAAEAAAEAARALAEAQSEEARRIAEAQAEAARQQQEALDRQQAIYESFADSVKNTFAGIRDSIMGAFNITEMGGRASSVLKNVKKLIEQTRKFGESIRSLAGQGLAPELLQQLIQAGPVAGGKLAASLVQSGVGDLNAAFSEYGALASGIAYTGTQSMFGTQAQQSIYNITVNGGVGSGPTIGKAIVDAIKSYERTSGAVWQGA